jgi:hypothetical protein
MNLERVSIVVIAPDGQPLAEGLNSRELAMLEAVDTALRAVKEFQLEFPDAVLERVESMRGVADDADGRLYLRYLTVKNLVPVEFWGGVAATPNLDWVAGHVRVSESNIAAQMTRAAKIETQIISPVKADSMPTDESLQILE